MEIKRELIFELPFGVQRTSNTYLTESDFLSRGKYGLPYDLTPILSRSEESNSVGLKSSPEEQISLSLSSCINTLGQTGCKDELR